MSGFEYDADKGLLFADIGEVEPAFSDAVKAGRYKRVSMSFYAPDAVKQSGAWPMVSKAC
ncbi:MAG: hypothetical protein U5K75_02365 [Ahrensia sp.]|nr:hypothetical protein [Ahrensia sp.]